MEQLVECMLCGMGIGKQSCSNCGKVVCAGCFVIEKGICKPCAGGKKMTAMPVT